MSSGECCRQCRFWLPTLKVKNQISDTEMRKVAAAGKCRRYAPSPAALTTSRMATKADDWCGDFEAAPGDQM
jgi:hypothetical protein